MVVTWEVAVTGTNETFLVTSYCKVCSINRLEGINWMKLLSWRKNCSNCCKYFWYSDQEVLDGGLGG